MITKQNYSRKEVIGIIDNLLQHSDTIIDVITNENTLLGPEDLLEMVESTIQQEKS